MIYIVIFLASLQFALMATPVFATAMSGKYYKVDLGNFNMAAGTTENNNYKLNTTVGQTPVGVANEAAYKVTAGFQFGSPTQNPFTITLSPLFVPFGPLSATTPVARAATVKVTNEAANGFVLFGSSDHPLASADDKQFVPSTTCDDGRCTIEKATPWQSTLSFGLGFRCDGATCPSDFQDKKNFRPFADTSKNEYPQALMLGKRGKDQKITLTLKVNINKSQATTPYSNVVTMIAAPTY